ncbi:D-glycero-alpha-D-manno-heptose-1,7-bisphosphate 7-phosphatase, partial [Rhodovulum sulfidophilum]|uniref:D-glycero-alpha-D-manno-heptose-1,7-bisphosphate 7-phosphatase n=1 Tax=Rhodovulum sulfidophilum TaxID=35806 RepID=UPI001F29E7C2
MQAFTTSRNPPSPMCPAPWISPTGAATSFSGPWRAAPAIPVPAPFEYVRDIGTPDRLQKAIADLDAGRPAHRSYRPPQPAVFLDRDGVINREIDGVTRAQDLHLLPRAAEAIAKLNAAGLPVILATNQPGVAKGILSLDELDEIHAHLDAQLAAECAFLDDRYVCIHHPEHGHPGERTHLKIDCTCRKPKGGLMRMAVQDHNLDLSRSVMVGDRDVDMAAVTSVGGRGVRVASNGENPPGHAGHIDAALLHNRRNQRLQRLVRRVSCSPSSAMSGLESHSATQDPSIMQQS